MRIVRAADRLLNAFLAILIALALLFGGFSLWDTVRIYSGAGTDAGLLKYKPAGASGPSLSGLTAQNPDVLAWLTLDGTGIDYPVVQGKTNMDYINKDVRGEYSLSGSIFADCRNSADFSDFYTLLYGHHMDGGLMFGDLTSFQDAEYFDSHTTGTLYTQGRVYSIELFACLMADAYDERVFDPTGQSGSEERENMLTYIQEHALHYRETDIGAQDHIIGFSTCSDATTNGRTVVYGRLTEVTGEEVSGKV